VRPGTFRPVSATSWIAVLEAASEDRRNARWNPLAQHFERIASMPTLSAAVPNWSVGDSIYFGQKALRVVGHRDDDADQPPVLIVEDVNRG
jgi:hypothetical protein